MIPYWILFLIPAIAVLISQNERRKVSMLPIMLFIAIAVFMIGLRFQVGGDWVNYLRQFYILQYLSLEEVVTTSDAGYAALNWLMDQLGWGIYGVNFASGAIFMAGLSVFALRMSNPWMAILVSIPYLLVVVAMYPLDLQYIISKVSYETVTKTIARPLGIHKVFYLLCSIHVAFD